MVTYPSLYEGFGNALLEAIYFRLPVILNRYSIFVQDIEPKGFHLLSMDGFVTSNLIDQVRRTLDDSTFRMEWWTITTQWLDAFTATLFFATTSAPCGKSFGGIILSATSHAYSSFQYEACFSEQLENLRRRLHVFTVMMRG